MITARGCCVSHAAVDVVIHCSSSLFLDDRSFCVTGVRCVWQLETVVQFVTANMMDENGAELKAVVRLSGGNPHHPLNLGGFLPCSWALVLRPHKATLASYLPVNQRLLHCNFTFFVAKIEAECGKTVIIWTVLKNKPFNLYMLAVSYQSLFVRETNPKTNVRAKACTTFRWGEGRRFWAEPPTNAQVR